MPRALDPAIAKDCINWWGNMGYHGYGLVRNYRTQQRAHRYIWEECFGHLDKKTVLHHECRNPACVNPIHITPMTRAQHSREHARDKTSCPQGHPYSEENTYYRIDKKRGWVTRKCRACHKEQERIRHHAAS